MADTRLTILLIDENPVRSAILEDGLREAGYANIVRLDTTHELLRRVWSGVVVEENNLHRQITALRKALGKDRDVIRTVSGRGYCFVSPVRASAAAPGTVSSSAWGAEPAGLSHQLVELSGRLAELEGQVGRMLALLRVDDTAKNCPRLTSQTQ